MLQQPRSESNPATALLDEALDEAHRAGDLLRGALALLGRDAGGIRDLVGAARCAVDNITASLERELIVTHARERSEQQRLHAQAPKHIGQEVR